MPVLVTKSATKPHYTDAPVPEPALRREHRLASVHEPRFSRAYLKVTRSLLTSSIKADLLQALRDVTAGRMTINEAVEVVPWYNPADPLASKLWEMLAASLHRALADTVEDAGEAEMRSLEIPLKFTVAKAVEGIRVPINPYSIEWVNTRAARLVAEISEDQRNLTRQIISENFEAGVRSEAILDDISQTVGLTEREWRAVENRDKALAATGMPEAARRLAVDKYADKLRKLRAKRIARTETITAYNKGLEDSWRVAQEEGHLEAETMKEWVEMTASSRTCKVCRGLGGQKVQLNEPFVSEITGEIERPPAHPDCRCTMFLVDVDDLTPEEIRQAKLDVAQARGRHQSRQTTESAAGTRTAPKAPKKAAPPEPTPEPPKPKPEPAAEVGPVKSDMDLRQAEQAIKNQDVENCVVFDAQGNQLFHESGTETAVGLSRKQLNAIHGKPGVTITHNHPSGSPLSVSDMQMAAELDLQEMLAIAPDNRVWKVVRPKQGWGWSLDELRSKTPAKQLRRAEQKAINRSRKRLEKMAKNKEIVKDDPRSLDLSRDVIDEEYQKAFKEAFGDRGWSLELDGGPRITKKAATDPATYTALTAGEIMRTGSNVLDKERFKAEQELLREFV